MQWDKYPQLQNQIVSSVLSYANNNSIYIDIARYNDNDE